MALKRKIKPTSKLPKKSVKQIPVQVAAEIIANYKTLPPLTKNIKIHSRQVLPSLLKGKVTPDETPTLSIKIDKN